MVEMALLVTRRAPELVVPARPTPNEIKHLSDIDDQESLRFQVPLIFVYKNNPSMRGDDPVEVIRKSLSKALVFYYPLAGRLIEGHHKKLMVDCNGKGVLFTEADANVEMDHLGDKIYPPCPHLNELLYNVPGSDHIIGCPLLLFQVTRFTCGGFAIAIRLNHTTCDASGLVNFLKAMDNMARGLDTPSLLPVWNRDILNARNPPNVTCTHHEYEQIPNTQDILQTTNPIDMDYKSFYFGPKELKTLRNHLPTPLRNCSTFELITATLWRCRTIALAHGPDEVVRVSCAISIRHKRYNMNIPLGYYGNTFVFPAVCSKVELLRKNPLAYAVELVKKAKSKMSEEYMRSVADLMVLNERARYTANGNFIVSDNKHAGFEDIEFGWGKPVFAGVATAVSLMSFYMNYKSKEGEHGTVVPICLPISAIKRFQEELSKMTTDHVEDLCNMKKEVVGLCKL